MRNLRFLAASTATLGLASLGLASCYSAGDLGTMPFVCTHTYSDCPDGYTCDFTQKAPMSVQKIVGGDAFYCTKPGGGMMMMQGGGLQFPATKTAYPNRYVPVMGLANNCPDDASIGHDIAHATKGDDTGATIGTTKPLAICPAGQQDVFVIDMTGQYANQFVRVSLTYKVLSGDLDVGIFDSMGKYQFGDLTSVDNACSVVPTPLSGTYYAVVTGAKDALGDDAINRYQIKIEKSAMMFVDCTSSPMPDMAGSTGDDAAF